MSWHWRTSRQWHPAFPRVRHSPVNGAFPAEGGYRPVLVGPVVGVGGNPPFLLLWSSPFQRAFRSPSLPRNVYSEIHLHITWHTKGNQPVLVDEIERQLHRYLKHRAIRTPGVFVHAIDGVADHVHLAVSVPPTINVSEWIGDLKGASAHFINGDICNRKMLEWQTGYGVVSFGAKDLPWVIQYVRNQKKHHAKGQVHDRLERIERPDDSAPSGKPVETG